MNEPNFPSPGRLWRADMRRTWKSLRGHALVKLAICARTPGVQAVTVFRFGQWMQTLPLPLRLPLGLVYAVLNLMVQVLWGIELPRRARIGPGLSIGHFGGIVISPDTVMGSNCGVSQGVTIGIGGSGDRTGVPVIGNDVYIAPGAKIFGAIRVGNNVKIGANAVVYKDVPDNAVVALVPGFTIVSMKGNRRPKAEAEPQPDPESERK